MDKTKMLLVVDMQNDFITGSLGSPDAQAIVDKVCQKIDNWDGRVCFTMDTHYEDYAESEEGRHIPVSHCVNETWGWQLQEDVAKRRTKESFIVYKESFGSMELPNIADILNVKEFQIIGLCTDICVISNALVLRSAMPDAVITVDASCCAGTSEWNHNAALDVMQKCCIDVINR